MMDNDRKNKEPIQVSLRRWQQLNRVYAVRDSSENTGNNVYWNAFSPPPRSMLGEFDIPSHSQSSQNQSPSSQQSSQGALNQISPSVLLGTVNKRTPPVSVMKRKTRSSKTMVRHDSCEELKNKFSNLLTTGVKRSKKASSGIQRSVQLSVSGNDNVSAASQSVTVVGTAGIASSSDYCEFPEDDGDVDWTAITEVTQAAEEAFINTSESTKIHKSSTVAVEMQQTPKRTGTRFPTRGSQKSLSGNSRCTLSCNNLEETNISIFENSTVSPTDFKTSPPTNLCFLDLETTATTTTATTTSVPSKTSDDSDSCYLNNTLIKAVSQAQVTPNGFDNDFDDEFDEIFSQIPLP